MTMTLNVNGKAYQVNVDENTPLLWVLRDVLGLTGTKYGCGIEECFACTVIIDGQAEHSCVFDTSSAVGKQIITIEGLSPNRSHPLQKAWIAHQVPQCGYCQPGMIMAGAAQMMAGHTAADEIMGEMHNICACGTYQRIREAVQSVGQ